MAARRVLQSLSGSFFKTIRSHCAACRQRTELTLYFGSDSHLHSKCEACKNEVVSLFVSALVTGERVRECERCFAVTVHFRYVSQREQTYWICSTCGRETTGM